MCLIAFDLLATKPQENPSLQQPQAEVATVTKSFRFWKTGDKNRLVSSQTICLIREPGS